MNRSKSRVTLTAAAMLAVAATVLAGCSTTQSSTPSALANFPVQSDNEVGEKWVVGMGDSYMSGEAGQWATNTTARTSNGGWQVGSAAQVYGSTAAAGDSIYRGCHRAASAPMNFGGDWKYENIACSGATTETVASESQTEYFKPGIDFKEVQTSDGQTGYGQAKALEEFAKTHTVDVIVLSIGGNDAGFGDVINDCVKAFLLATPGSDYCKDKAQQKEQVTAAAKERLTAKVSGAIANISTAMTNAGYSASEYRIVYQLPPAPIAPSSELRWGQTYSRAAIGGCGIYNKDIDWLLNTYAPFIRSAMTEGAYRAAESGGQSDIRVVDNTELFDGHLLCQDGATRMDGEGNPPPESTQINTEWVRLISIGDAKWRSNKDALTEPVHPMYWGQRALAGCNRAAANSPNGEGPQMFTCTLGAGSNGEGDPNVELAPR